MDRKRRYKFMKIQALILVLSILIFATTLTDGKREKELDITSLTIQFNKTDAIFTINYNFNKISKTFLLIFGSGTVEPKIKSIFQNFDYEVIKIDYDKTILRVKNISRLNKGYYLHNSQKFGETIGTIYISDPSNNRTREYYNINATPDYFYKS